jgi:hypothetical protein
VVPAGSRDSGSVAWRQRATSPSPSVWPLMAADGPMRTGLARRLQASQSRSQPGSDVRRAVAVCFTAASSISTRNGGRTSAQGLRVEAMRARLEPSASVACALARPAAVASSGPVQGAAQPRIRDSGSQPPRRRRRQQH